MTANEDNIRVLLLAFMLGMYMLIGGVIIQNFESQTEDEFVILYLKAYKSFEQKLINGTANLEELQELLYTHGNLTSRGLHKSKRWNLLGSTHFVATIITTIGYGSYPPNTVAGRMFVIIYGLLGCSGGILFLNLFLERIITFLAYILRILYIKQLVYKGRDIENIDDWKPSVYWVMTCLMIISLFVASTSVLVYSYMENWSMLESAYFCFVAFSTIGFGDFVPLQKEIYPYKIIYIFANVIILVSGCCCLYSLFNVISILLKQVLNKIIPYMNYQNLFKEKDDPDTVLRRYSLKMQRERDRRRRSSITLQKVLRRNRPFYVESRGSVCNTLAGGADEFSSNESRKVSDGMISLKDFLTSNQVTLAMMQKELCESAQMRRDGVPFQDRTTRFIPGTIGPLAILCNKLGGNR